MKSVLESTTAELVELRKSHNAIFIERQKLKRKNERLIKHAKILAYQSVVTPEELEEAKSAIRECEEV